MRNGLIAALDVGSTKVCCFIARVQDDGTPRIIGIGHQISRGMKAGAVVDIDDLEHSIRAAVDAAEDMAGERIKSVVMNISSGPYLSRTTTVETKLNGHAVGEGDIRSMMERVRAGQETAERDLVHIIPLDYVIDASEGIKDPRGMYGEKLSVSVHTLSTPMGPVRNLVGVVGRCHLELETRVVSPYAAGLACLVDDEKQLGVTCIDMGGGTTKISVFRGGQLVHAGVIGVGGQHITSDVASMFSTTTVYAERIKTLYGAAISSPADEREIIKIPLVGEDDAGGHNQITKMQLIQIITPRLEETLEMVRAHLREAGFDRSAGRRVVLTGGGSLLQGVREMAGALLDKQVRLGRPQGFQGLAEATGGPQFSVCAGLIRYAMTHNSDPVRGPKNDSGSQSRFGRLGQWIKSNF